MSIELDMNKPAEEAAPEKQQMVRNPVTGQLTATPPTPEELESQAAEHNAEEESANG